MLGERGIVGIALMSCFLAEVSTSLVKSHVLLSVSTNEVGPPLLLGDSAVEK